MKPNPRHKKPTLAERRLDARIKAWAGLDPKKQGRTGGYHKPGSNKH